MAGERRTKAQKVNTQIKHSNGGMTYSFARQGSSTRSEQPAKVPTLQSKHKLVTLTSDTQMSDLFSYDVSFIYTDLLKTVILTLIMFATLIGLSFII